LPCSVLRGAPRAVRSATMTDPRNYESAETLKNGLAIKVRALRQDDRDRMARAVRNLDPKSIYLRLFTARRELTEAGLNRLMRFDPASEILLVAVIGAPDETIIGAGRYMVVRLGVAEIAFTVAKDHPRQGIASRLLWHLATVARDQGIGMFEAETLSENKAMRAVFEKTGWPLRSTREGNVVHTTLTLPPQDSRRNRTITANEPEAR